jgi:hypothetical protein
MGRDFNREFPTDANGNIPPRLSRWLQYEPNLNVVVFAPAKALFSTTHHILGNCHQRATNNCLLSTDKAERRQRLMKATRIMIIRDPFDRALSAYFNSVNNTYIRVGVRCTAKTCSFLEWMRHLKNGGIYVNEHFWSQVRDSYFAQMHYDYVIRFGVKKDMECLYELLNATTRKHSNPSSNSELSLSEKLKLYTPEIVSIMVELYQLDLSVWRMAKMFSPYRSESSLSDFLTGGNASEDYKCVGKLVRSSPY